MDFTSIIRVRNPFYSKHVCNCSLSATEEVQGATSKSEGGNARVTVKIALKPKMGKDELKQKYRVQKYSLSEGYSIGEGLKSMVPKGTPEFVEHGENYVERIMRALYHFKQCALIGPSGTGKSVCEGEQVLVADSGNLKLTTVSTLFENLSRKLPVSTDPDGWQTIPLAGCDIRVLSMDQTTGELSWKRPYAMARSYYRGDVLEITTKRNRSVTVTPDHSLITEQGPAKASQIVEGTSVPIIRRIPQISSPPTTSLELSGFLSGAELTGAGVVMASKGGLQIPAPPAVLLDESFAWFLGFFVAGGYIGDGFASICNANPDLMERCTITAASLGLGTMVRRQRGLIELRIFSKAFVSFLSSVTLSRRVGTGKGSQARYKRVPDFVFTMPEGLRKAFLKGFFKGDGWEEQKNEVLHGTSSKELAAGLTLLCEQSGVFPTVRVKADGSYAITIAKDGISEIGFDASNLDPSADKRGHVEKVKVTPEMLALAKRAYSRLPPNLRTKKFHKRTVSCLYTRTGMIGLETLRRIATEVKSAELERIAASSILWDPIREVRKLRYDGWVYDFQVPGTETFVAGFGGVVTHNTHLVYLVAELAGLPLWEINCGLQTSVYDLFGRFVGLGKENWVDGQIVSWCRYCGILYLDEANMMKQDIATRLNPILDTRGHMVLNERDNEVIPRHANGYVVISMNPYSAEFAGTKPLNAAFRRRMSVWLDFDYLSVGSKIADDEVEMISKRAKIDLQVAEKLVRIAAEIRRQYKAGDLPYAPSVGDLVNWATLVADGLTPAQAAEETLVALTSDDIEVQNSVRRVVKMVVGDSREPR
jgi:nitric oxide reductase NorQ protein